MNTLELMRLVTRDGLTYNLNNQTKARYLLDSIPGNWGLPPINFVRNKPYQFDGQIELGYYLEPRIFSLRLGGEGCSRQDLWTLRTNLINAVRPNRGGQMTLIFRQPNGTEYAIDGRVTQLAFPPQNQDEWYEWGYQDEVLFEAVAPWFYNFSSSVVTGVQDVFPELVFPITFTPGVSIVFGSGAQWGNVTIHYAGNWYAYPRIVVTGPADNIRITHRQLGFRLAWIGSIVAGQSVIFDLRRNYNASGQWEGVTVTNNTGQNVFNQLDPNTNLERFRIEPDGIVPNGINIFDFEADNTDTINTSITMTYNTAFIGI